MICPLWKLSNAGRSPRLSHVRDGARAGEPARRALVNRAAFRRLALAGFDPWRVTHRCRLREASGSIIIVPQLESLRQIGVKTRSDKRREGKECVRTGRIRGSPLK